LAAASDLSFRSIAGRRHRDDYDVFDGERCVGRIYLVQIYESRVNWFWGVSFEVFGRKSFGYAASPEEAKAAFKTEYERWQSDR
jgi:hypothetical protein